MVVGGLTGALPLPYGKPIQINPRKTIVMVTSNEAKFTKDFSNRTSIICLRKQTPGYGFAKFSRGDLITHVRANQPWYLGAVFSVVKAWHAAGKQRSPTADHDFRGWCQVMDWIVTQVLGEAPLLAGHRQIQQRTANANLSWVRLVAQAVEHEGRLDEWLRPNGILEILLAAGDIEIPGISEGASIEDEDVRPKAYRAIGTRLSNCFGRGEDRLELTEYVIERHEVSDDDFRGRREYRFSACQAPTSPPTVPEVTPEHELQ
jgi:hypothetical protein